MSEVSKRAFDGFFIGPDDIHMLRQRYLEGPRS